MKQTKITNYLANVDMLEGPVAAFIYTLCTLAPACTRPVHSRSKRARTARTLSFALTPSALAMKLTLFGQCTYA
jgi:hypothetical protein